MWIIKLYFNKMGIISFFHIVTIKIKLLLSICLLFKSIHLSVYLSILLCILASNNYSTNLKPFLLYSFPLQSKLILKGCHMAEEVELRVWRWAWVLDLNPNTGVFSLHILEQVIEVGVSVYLSGEKHSDCIGLYDRTNKWWK